MILDLSSLLYFTNKNERRECNALIVLVFTSTLKGSNKEKNRLLAEKKAAQKAARLAKKQANQARIEQEKLKKAQKATEKLKKEALAAQRVAEKMKAQLLKEKQAAAEAKKRAEKQRAQKLAQELAQKRAQEQASAIQRQVNEYLAYIVEKIEGSRQFMLHLAPDLLVDVSFLLLPDGSIKNLVIQKSSGSTPYDESALMAVRKAAPFDNMPDAPEVLKHLNRVMTFGFKNEHNM